MTPELPVLDDAWILARRGPRNTVDPMRPYAMLVEPERTRRGEIEDVATIFITNRECPFRCLMCDLWKNTTDRSVPVGAVSAQITWALDQLPPARHVKLYNSGNFFDAQAIPRADWPAIAAAVRGFQTVIVESHPRLVTGRSLEFARMIEGELQVAMGLETVDPEVLPRLNKRMALRGFEQATRFLVDQGIAVRAFVLLRTPFQNETQGAHWAKRSIEWAFAIGVECCAVIPTRMGNGAMDRLAELGYFAVPTLESLCDVLEYGISLRKGRVFADLWEIKRLAHHTSDPTTLIERLRRMNLTQQVFAADSAVGQSA